MLAWLEKWYDRLILGSPRSTLLVLALLVGAAGLYAPDFKLDASADSLVLENDRDLRYYRALRARYGSDDYLIISYTPRGDLMSDAVLDDLRQLQSRLQAMTRVASVTSVLNVPLIDSPRISLDKVQQEIPTLETEGIDRQLARRELRTSPLYGNMLLSSDGKTTALQVRFRRDERYFELLHRRDRLREKDLAGGFPPEEARELERVSAEFKDYKSTLLDQEMADIAQVRRILAD